MNKFLVISIGVVVGVGLVMLIIFKLLISSVDQSPTTNTPGNLNTGSSPTTVVTGTSGSQDSSTPDSNGSTPTQSGTKVPITTSDGGTIQVTDLRNDSAVVKDPANAGYYYIGYHYSGGVSDPTASENPPYVILYIASTGYFNITLLQEPIADMRREAEQYLMSHLGISQDQMCQLNYTVAVINAVNSFYAGKDLRFSFCSGATPL